MSVIYLMAPLALLLSLGFIGAFVWATRSGQWDDLDLTPKRILQDNKNNGDKNDLKK